MKRISVILISIILVSSSVIGVQNTTTKTTADNIELRQQAAEKLKVELETKRAAAEKLKIELAAKKAAADKTKAELELKKQQAEIKKTEFKTKKEEYIAFKDSLNSKKEELKINKNENKKLLDLNKELRKNIKGEITRIKENKITLDSNMLDFVKEKSKQVKDVISNLASTNGKITSLLNQNKDLIKNKDYVQMDIVYSQISEIQQSRNNELIYANTLLNDILSVLKGII